MLILLSNPSILQASTPSTTVTSGRPRFDLNKLMDMHGEGSGKTIVTTDAVAGEAVQRPESYEPPVLESVYVECASPYYRCNQ